MSEWLLDSDAGSPVERNWPPEVFKFMWFSFRSTLEVWIRTRPFQLTGIDLQLSIRLARRSNMVVKAMTIVINLPLISGVC